MNIDYFNREVSHEIQKCRKKAAIILIREEQKRRKKMRKRMRKLIEISLKPILPSVIGNHIGKYVPIQFAISKEIKNRMKYEQHRKYRCVGRVNSIPVVESL